MTARASWNGVVLAESDDTIIVEGNHYFPPSALRHEYFRESATSSHCPWKGDASYFSVVSGDEVNEDAAWYYREPYAKAEEIKGYVAFWRGVEVSAADDDGREGPTPNN